MQISKPVDTNQRTETKTVALPEYHVCILVWCTKYKKETQNKLKVKWLGSNECPTLDQSHHER